MKPVKDYQEELIKVQSWYIERTKAYIVLHENLNNNLEICNDIINLFHRCKNNKDEITFEQTLNEIMVKVNYLEDRNIEAANKLKIIE